MGAELGFEMCVLDIGGGFCGGDFDAAGNVDLGGVPAAVNEALDRLFPDDGEHIGDGGRWCGALCSVECRACLLQELPRVVLAAPLLSAEGEA